MNATPEAQNEWSAIEPRWHALTNDERREVFRAMPIGEAAAFFATRSPPTQAAILPSRSGDEQRILLRLLAPDDAADLVRQLEGPARAEALSRLDERTRAEVAGLLAYAEDVAGGRMNPRFVRLRPEMSAQEAIAYTLKQGREKSETLHYLYVLDEAGRPLGVLSLRELLTAPLERPLRDVMRRAMVTVREDAERSELARITARHGLAAIPVVAADGRMVGIVTADDVVGVVEAEATDDIQKLGATQGLDKPYLQATLWDLVRSRAGWLVVLFLGEMLAASALGHFEAELHQAMLLALFIPLIIASGGNAGAQATTLVVRSMALGKLTGAELGRTLRREVLVGLALGCILAALGASRVLAGGLWGESNGITSEIALIVGASLITVVALGSLVGSALPFALRRLRFDPATASAPLVATVVDVVGIVTYFAIARAVLSGVA